MSKEENKEEIKEETNEEANEEANEETLSVEENETRLSRIGSVLIKGSDNKIHNRRISSLGNDSDIINRMKTRYGSGTSGDFADIRQQISAEVAAANKNNNNNNNNDDANKSKTKNNNENEDGDDNDDDDDGRKDTDTVHGIQNNPMMEVNRINANIEAIEQAFSSAIDPDNNGDVDINEWMNGLKELGVNLTDTEIKIVFNILSKNDDYVDKSDFVNFLSITYTNPENQKYQREIMKCVIAAARRHESTHSNLLQATESKDWNNLEVVALQKEMEEHMTSLVREMSQKIEVETKFVEELEKIELNEPEKLKDENVKKWTKYEVVHWLVNRLKLEQYARVFQQEDVDGEMLLYDLNEHMLLNDMAIKNIHAKKIMRAIQDLRRLVRTTTDQLYDFDVFVNGHFEDIEVRQEADNVKTELDKQIELKKELKDYYEAEIVKLKENINKLEQQLTEYKKKESALAANGIIPSLMNNNNSNNNNNNNPLSGIQITPELEIWLNNIVSKKKGNKKIIKKIVKQKIENSNDNDIKNDNESTTDNDNDNNNNNNNNEYKDVEVEEEVYENGNTDFASHKRVLDWTRDEVAYWAGIEINFPIYAYIMWGLNVEGEMLLKDVNKETLLDDMNVKKIHIERILREITKLKKELRNFKYDQQTWSISHIVPEDNRASQDTIDALKIKVDLLSNERDQLIHELENINNNDDNEKGYFSTKIKELEEEKDKLNEQVNQLNKELNDKKKQNMKHKFHY